MTTKTTWQNRITGHGLEKPAQLLANPRNWRIHPKAQQDALSGLLDTVGWVQDVIVNQRTGHVVDGHLRVSLAISRDEREIPVVYVDLAPEEEALVLATLDPLAAMAVTDQDMLAELMGDVSATGALADMLQELSGNKARAGLNDPDAVPATPDEPTTKPGDLWLLGEHRLMCGSATKAEDVERLLAGAVPHMCVTDPPYGVEYDPNWRNVEAAKGNLAYAARRVGEVTNDDRADWGEAWDLFPGDVIYSWHPAGATSLVHAAALQASGFVLRMQIIWSKSNFPIGRGDYHVRHEPCWYAVRKGKAAKRTRDRKQTTVWEIGETPTQEQLLAKRLEAVEDSSVWNVNLDKNVEGGHSTQKPIECMQRPIRNHEADAVYDPFVGSGTTIIAAEREGRRCYAMELEPRYVDVAVRRWEQYTGETAVLA